MSVKAFTSRYKGLSRVLMTEVDIAPTFDPAGAPAEKPAEYVRFKAIWDTGATASVITQKIVDALHLVPTGVTQVHHAHGKTMAEVYLVNVGLPNRVAFSGVRVTKGDLASCDVLIGMDVISQGDFAVSNHQGKTTFSFRIPSVEETDYVNSKLPPFHAPPKVGRNDPCPCGSGKKYKKCCEGK